MTHKLEITLVYNDPGPRTIKSASLKASIASSIGCTSLGSKNTRSIFLCFLGIFVSPKTISPSSITAFNCTLVFVDGMTLPLIFKILLNALMACPKSFVILVIPAINKLPNE
ncbi:Uncharacterised protein [Staphylococcus aureus]|nr:Uncharacterised protein [Staphylococcus aureus]CAC7584027.1 Uncharacterised protein [Staphylococcus aureus]